MRKPGDTLVKFGGPGAQEKCLAAPGWAQEIAAAQEAQRKASKDLHEARRTQHKEDSHAKVEQLKSKLHRSKAGAGA